MRSKNAFVLGGWAVLVAAFAGAPALAQTRGTRKVVVPSPGFRTIQQGIDAVPAGGTVIVKPGTYQETLIIGKEVSLIGAGARPTEVVPADRATGIVTYVAGGGGEIKAMTVRGGHAGILGIATDNRVPAALEVKDLIIEDSGRGILGSFSELTVKETRIRNTVWNGASVLEGTLKFLGSNVLGALGAGLLVLNSTGTVRSRSPTPISSGTRARASSSLATPSPSRSTTATWSPITRPGSSSSVWEPVRSPTAVPP